MLDNYLVRLNSLENVYDAAGNAVGFKFGVRNANYRGVFLSLHNGYFINMDGVVYPREKQRFEINGKPPRDFEEIKKAVWEHWDYDEEGFVYVEKPGGLAPGMHHLEFQQSILAAYGYMPTDEEWVKNPPVPGSGAGSDKTIFIVSFDLELQKGGKKNG
jgi:hypothetical protein